MSKSKTQSLADLRNIPTENILVKDGFNPRRVLGDVTALAASIKKEGLINPILVSPIKGEDDKYYIVAGHRRFQACCELNLSTVPCNVRADLNLNSHLSYQKARGIAIAENSGDLRTQLPPIDEALAFKEMLDKGEMSEVQIAKESGYSVTYVINALKLLIVPDDVKERVNNREIPKGVAQVVADAPEEIRDVVAAQAVPGCSVSDIRRAVVDAHQSVIEKKRDKKHKSVIENIKEASKDSNTLFLHTPRSKAVMLRKIKAIAVDMLNVSEFDPNTDVHIGPSAGDEILYNMKAQQLSALFWACGKLDEISTTTTAFHDAVNDVQAQLDEEREAAKNEPSGGNIDNTPTRKAAPAKPCPTVDDDDDTDSPKHAAVAQDEDDDDDLKPVKRPAAKRSPVVVMDDDEDEVAEEDIDA